MGSAFGNRIMALAGVPIAFAFDVDPGAVHCPAVHHEVMSRGGDQQKR
ncbi:hypothetical protein [Oceanicola sp. D3]